MELRDALRATPSVRDFDGRPVPDELLAAILDDARFAPSGGNRQGWRVVVVQDPQRRARIRDLYREGWRDYLALAGAGLVPWNPLADRERERLVLAEAAARRSEPRAATGAEEFAEHLNEAPVLLLLLVDLAALATIDRDAGRYTLVGGASVYPFAWSILLAARPHGIGGVLTTIVVRQEPAVLELLGAPPTMAVAAMLALGYPREPPPTRLRRASVASFTTIDRLDGPPLAP